MTITLLTFSCNMYAVISALCVVFVFTAILLPETDAKPVFLVVAPNKIRFNTENTLIVSATGLSEPMTIKLELTDDDRTLWTKHLSLTQDGVIKNVTFSLDLDDVYAQSTKVYLLASDGEMHVHESLELDRSSGYLIIQTDKPFYTPRQTVRYRVVALGEDQHWAPWKVRIDIISPEGIILDRTIHSSKGSFTGKTFQLPKEATHGEWRVTASFITYTKHSPKSKEPENKELSHGVNPEKIADKHISMREDIPVVTNDGTEILLTVTAVYFFCTIDKEGIHNRSDLSEPYSGPIRAAIIHAIKTAAGTFSVKDFASRQPFVKSQINKSLWINSSNFCCYGNSTLTNYGCKPTPVCKGKGAVNLLVGFLNFQFVNVPIPTKVLSQLGIAKLKRPIPGNVKPADQASSITKVTVGKNVTTVFEVKEYVLPTFSASLEVSTRVILETTKNFTIRVKAKYLHQKGIAGNVVVRLGVVRTDDVALFRKVYNKEIDDGHAEITVNVTEWKTSSLWFPSSESVLYVEANVTDESSLETQTLQNQSTVFATSVFKFPSIHDKYFIPGKAYHFQTKLVYANNDPASGIRVKIIAFSDDGRRRTKIGGVNKVTSDNGETHVKLPAGLLKHSIQKIYFQMTKEKDLLSDEITHYYYPVRVEEESISDHHLSLKVLPSETSDVLVEVTHTAQLLRHQVVYLHVLVEAKGKIVYTTSYRMRYHGTHVVTIPGSLAPKLSPHAYLTAFYTLTGYNLQIVADYIQLNVTRQCLEELQVLHDRDYSKQHTEKPGADVRVHLRGAPGMVVGLLAVDKAVYVINNRKSLSQNSLFKEFASHNLGTGEKNSLDNLKYKDIFKKAGFVLLTNIEKMKEKQVRKPPVKPTVLTGSKESKKILFAFDRIPLQNKFLDSISRNVYNPSVKWERVEEDDFDSIPLPSPRSYFPESWMFQEEVLKQKNQMISVKLPDSITTWVIEAVGVSASQGVCVSQPLELTTFKPFFAKVWLPYKAVRLEKVNIRFSVFNYLKWWLRILVTITADEAICITDKIHGKKKLRFQTRIAADSSKGNDFSVIPLKAGLHKIRIVVKGHRDVDVIEKTLYVVAEGKRVKKTLSFPLDPAGRRVEKVLAHRTFDNKESTIHNTWELGKQEQKTLVDLALPAELIPGTDRCDIFAYGDLMADVIVMMLSGSEDLMGSAVSDGEEVLGNLAPVIHAIKYTQLAKLKTSDVEEKGQNFVRNGIARLLKYRKSDGSFSLLHDSDSSTWFTAVVLKTLCQARDIVYVDEEFINAGFLWLLDHVNDDDTMEETDPIYDRFQSSEDKIPNLAAEVLIALMECDLTEQLDHLQLQGSLLFYLEDYFVEIVDVQVLAKVAYALYLTESPDLPDVLDMLNSAKKVTTEGLVYWSDEEDLEEDLQKPHWYQHGPDELTIEATAYALLVSIKQAVTEIDVEPVAEWIIRQRGTNGAFVGALDTVIATQALAAYSLNRNTEHPKSDLQCNISTEHSAKYHSTIRFSHKDAIVKKALSDVPTGEEYTFISSGTGLGEVQIEARYNVPVENNDNCRYNISVTRGPLKGTQDENIENRAGPLCKYCGFGCGAVTNASEDGASAGHGGQTRVASSRASLCVEICLRRTDGKTVQGVTVEAAMLSGFVPLPISTEQMSVMTVGRVKSHKYDSYRESLITHFHSVPVNESACFGFLAEDRKVVSRHRPATITLTEHGKKEASCSLSYDAGREVSLPVLCTQPSESRSRECVCTTGSCGVCARTKHHKYRFILEKVCSSDYIYQMQHREMEEIGPWKRIPAEVLSVNKTGYNKVVPGQDIILSVPRYCRCPVYPPDVPHYMIGTDLSRTKDIDGIDLYIVDDSTFFVMVKNVKEPEHHRKLKGYVIKEKLLRAALTRDKQKRCPRNL